MNDDVNKFLWTRLGWSQTASIDETLGDYSRYFIGPDLGAAFAKSLLALERDWTGPAATNAEIPKTLASLQALERAATPAQRENWRFESALYRGYYDAFIQQRLVAEQRQEAAALAALRLAPKTDSSEAIAAALVALKPQPASLLRAPLFAFAGALYQQIGLQLSVAKYGASGIERGANLDRVDVSLNDRAWLTRQFAEIQRLPTEAERLARIAVIANWQHPTPDTLYDDLGDPTNEPHLVRGEGFSADPELFHSAINGIADQTPDDGWRMSWISYAERLYESPLELSYQNLDSTRAYTVRITYAGEGYTVPIKLVANNTVVIHPYFKRPANPTTVEFPIPGAAIQHGTLDLRWIPESGAGGSGRGHQVAEVWLIPTQRSRKKPKVDRLGYK